MTRAVNTALAGSGGVLQVVSATKTDTFSLASGTFTDVTGLSVSITPVSTSSRILITGVVNLSADFNNIYGWRLARNGNAIFIGDADGSRIRGTGARMQYGNATNYNFGIDPHAFTFVDSPSATSALTYAIQIRTEGVSYTTFVNRSVLNNDSSANAYRTASSITVMEIAG